MRLFHPLGFMLASPVDSPEEAVARFTATARVPHPTQSNSEGGRRPSTAKKRSTIIQAFLEDKYDGMRAQLHCGDPDQPGRVAIYSRNREDVTESFPELAEAFAHVDPATDGPMILDGEILGWDFAPPKRVPHASEHWMVEPTSPNASDRTIHALPFAVLGQRIGRKRVSNQMRTQIPVIYMAFDLLYAAGELTLDLPLRERRNRLEAIVERLAQPHRLPTRTRRPRIRPIPPLPTDNGEPRAT